MDEQKQSEPVMFEGAEVISILELGDETHRCRMSDGTVNDVPVNLFEAGSIPIEEDE